MLKPLFIYVHGFNSSPQSYKARLLIDWLKQQGREDEVRVPELSHWPKRAIDTLETLIETHRDRKILLLGSSLGGFYSTYLVEKFASTNQQTTTEAKACGGLDLKCVLINPAVRPDQLLEELLGENQNLYSQERYQLTHQHLEQLQQLRSESVQDTSRYLLLTQTADEVLDYRQAVELYDGAEMIVQEGGSHGFDDFESMLPLIEQFAQRP